MAIKFDGSTDYYQYSGDITAGTTYPLSLAGWAKPDDTTSGGHIIALGNTVVDNSFAWLQLWTDGHFYVDCREPTTGFDEADGGPYTANQWHHYGGTFDTTGVSAWLDGSFVQKTTTTLDPPDINRTLVGARDDFGTIDKWMKGDLAEVAAWSVVLETAEWEALAAGVSPLLVRPDKLIAYAPLSALTDPMQDLIGGHNWAANGTPVTAAHPRIIEPSQQGIYLPPFHGIYGTPTFDVDVDVGASAITGTCVITSGASAALTASGDLAGTSALTTGATAILVAAGVLDGSADITFSASSSLVAAGSLAGSASIAFGASASLNASGALAGSSAITLASSASLAALGDLAGSAAITFGSSASLTALGALAGSAAITFASSADLGGVGSSVLTGSASITFGSSASLVGAGQLAGTATMTFAESAALTASGALAGTVPIVFGSSADLSGLIGDSAITGTCAIAFGASGDLVGSGALAGSSAITFGQAADLIGAGALAGTISVAFGTSGSLAVGESTGVLAGTCIVAFDQSASLTGTGAVTGTCTITFGSSASLINKAFALGGTYNAIEYYPVGSTVTIEVFNPVDGVLVGTTDSTVLEVPLTGRFIWDAENITIQPTSYQEYGYVMTDGITPKGGVIRMNMDTEALAQLAALYKRFDLDKTDQNTYANDGSVIANNEFTLTKTDNGDGTFDVIRSDT